jgi:hypothetical protein
VVQRVRWLIGTVIAVTLGGGIVVLPSETLESATSATHNQQPSSEDRRDETR